MTNYLQLKTRRNSLFGRLTAIKASIGLWQRYDKAALSVFTKPMEKHNSKLENYLR